jgi:hypothetical protein
MGADLSIILTEAGQVYLNFGKKEKNGQQALLGRGEMAPQRGPISGWEHGPQGRGPHPFY